MCFKKHAVIVANSKQIVALGCDEEYMALEEEPWLPSLKEFIEIFVAKSQYYSTWKKEFDDAIRTPVMHDWLKAEEDRKSDRAVWGEDKQSYSFEDLKVYNRKKARERELEVQHAEERKSGPTSSAKKTVAKKKKSHKSKRKDDSE